MFSLTGVTVPSRVVFVDRLVGYAMVGWLIVLREVVVVECRVVRVEGLHLGRACGRVE